MKKDEWPEKGDFIVVRIKRIMNYGAIAELLEYPKKEGFIHISQVASSWIKNIRSFLSEGQIRVALVKKIDPEKRMVDISLRDVSAQQEKKKQSKWRKEKRADKLFERICHELKEPYEESYEKIAYPLKEKFEDLYSALEEMSMNGEEVLKGLKIPQKWKKALVKKAEENITISGVEINGNFSLQIISEDGVNVIKDAFKKVESMEGVEVMYVSAPRYKVKITAADYEEAENKLNKATEAVINYVEKKGGKGSFERK